MKPGSGDVINLLTPDREKWIVYLDGEMVLWSVLEAKCGDFGYVVHYIIAPNGEPLTGGDGNLLKKKRFGKVEFRENPSYVTPKSIFSF